MVADPARRRAFVAGSELSNGVAVVDGTGRVRKVFQHLPGPRGMALDERHSRLFVALYDTSSVAVINTRTLSLRLIRIAGVCPTTIAYQAGLVWLGTNCESGGTGGEALGVLDPATGRLTVLPIASGFPGDLFTAPEHPRALFVRDPDDTDHPEKLVISGGARPHARRVLDRSVTTPGATDEAGTPDGLALVMGSPLGSWTVQSARSLHRFLIDYRLPGSPAVAVRSDGLVATGGKGSVTLDREATKPPPRRHLTFPAGEVQPPKSLAFDRDDLFAVVPDVHSTGYAVRVLRMPPVRTLTASTDTEFQRAGETAAVVGHVVGARRSVRIYARPYGARHRHLVKAGRVDADGNLTGHLRVRVRTRFTVVAPASRGHRRLTAGMTASPFVRFRDRIDDATGRTTSSTQMPMGSRPRITTRVSPDHAGECVHVVVRQYNGTGFARVDTSRCLRLSRAGRASYTVPAKWSAGDISLEAVFEGDARNKATLGPVHEVWFPCQQPGEQSPGCDPAN